MRNGLLTVFADVKDQSVTALANSFLRDDFVGQAKQIGVNASVGARLLVDASHVFLRNDENVDRRLGRNVSSKASAVSLSATTFAGMSPATILQKRQSLI